MHGTIRIAELPKDLHLTEATVKITPGTLGLAPLKGAWVKCVVRFLAIARHISFRLQIRAIAMVRRRPIRVLLIKCFQPTTSNTNCPPLGLLYLAATLREKFGNDVEVTLVDRCLTRSRFDTSVELVKEFRPDVVGFSALNWDAEECSRSALEIKKAFPEVVIALGGPFVHRNTLRICALGVYDWIFDGEADLSFPIAVHRWFRGDKSLGDIVGLTWRDGDRYQNNADYVRLDKPMVGVVEDLDALPFPAWDLVDFDAYARTTCMNHMLRGKRYAPVFTSRGCPFLCTYCHDIFGKKFRWRSIDNVVAELTLLREKYGVDELEIVDDIFNMHSERMKAICRAITPLKMHLCFPNGLRFDILDEEGVDALVDAGTYSACVAVETVTPRLQEIIKKRLHIERTQQAIKWMADRKVLVRGFFMVGFPTETLEEIQATIDYACKSELSQAYFFQVTPQPGTPLYDLATDIDKDAVQGQIAQEYGVSNSWYSAAYKVNLKKIQRWAFLRFYFGRPVRTWRLVRTMKMRDLFCNFVIFLRLIVFGSGRAEEPLPEALQPLGQLFTPDEVAVTSAYVLHNGNRRQVGVEPHSHIINPAFPG